MSHSNTGTHVSGCLWTMHHIIAIVQNRLNVKAVIGTACDIGQIPVAVHINTRTLLINRQHGRHLHVFIHVPLCHLANLLANA